MQTIALVAGLVGAILSAALGFFARMYLDWRAQLRAERKLAYVHFVSISEVLAAEELIKRYLGALEIPALYHALGDKTGAFEPSHKACVLIADHLFKVPAEDLRSPEKNSLQPKLLRYLIEGIKDSKLTVEQLSNLPKEIVPTMLKLQSYVLQIMMCLDQWIEFVEQDKREWLNARVIHEQWLLLNRFLASVREVRHAMIAAGVVTKDDANKLFDHQLKTIASIGFSNVLNKPKLEAAMKSVADGGRESSNNKSSG